MTLYRVTIGARSAPRLSFECEAEDSMDCAMQHLSLTQTGECMRVDAVPPSLERAVHQRREAGSLLTSPAT